MKKWLPILALSVLLVACGPKAEGADPVQDAPAGAEAEAGRPSEDFNPADAEKSLMDVAETFLTEYPQGQIHEIAYKGDIDRFTVAGAMGEKAVSLELPATGTKIASKDEAVAAGQTDAPVLDVGPLAEWKEAVEAAKAARPDAAFDGFVLRAEGDRAVYEMQFDGGTSVQMDAETLQIFPAS